MTEQEIENQLWKLCERIKNGVDSKEEVNKIIEEIKKLKNEENYNVENDPLKFTGQGELIAMLYSAYND